MKKPKTHCFRGLDYKILWRKPRNQPSTCGGTCNGPSKRTIEIHPDLKGKEKLRILIDESIHACLWDIDNDSVGETSSSISEFLWECGVRVIDEE